MADVPAAAGKLHALTKQAVEQSRRTIHGEAQNRVEPHRCTGRVRGGGDGVGFAGTERRSQSSTLSKSSAQVARTPGLTVEKLESQRRQLHARCCCQADNEHCRLGHECERQGGGAAGVLPAPPPLAHQPGAALRMAICTRRQGGFSRKVKGMLCGPAEANASIQAALFGPAHLRPG